MININLLPGQKRKTGGGGGGGFKFALPDFSALIANVKDPWLIAAVLAWVLIGGGSAALFILDTSRLAALDSRLEGVKAEKRRFDVVIAQKRQSERIRDSLLAEIVVIRGIDADRYVWPHILDQVTKALPPFTWLTSVQQVGNVSTAVPASQAGGPPPATDTTGGPAVRVSIDGQTVDFQAYTTFLRQLTASPWLADVSPNTSTTVTVLDRPVTQFNVTVRYRVADSVYIRTVPMTQAVR
jgi:type IV pilus assembly protein PilN